MMPPPGMSPQQTQQWSQGMQDSLRKGGQNPATFGFAQAQAGVQRPVIQRPGQAQPQQDPYGSATPYGGTATPSKPGPGRPSVMTAYGGQNVGPKPQQATPSKPSPGVPSMPMYQGRPPGSAGKQQPAPPQQYDGPMPSDYGVDFRAPPVRPQYIQPDGSRSHVNPSQQQVYGKLGPNARPGTSDVVGVPNAWEGQPQLSGLLAHDAPWWAGEWGHLPHAPGDNRPAYVDGRPTGANAGNWMNQGPSQTGLPAGGQMIEPPDWFAPGGGGGVPLKPGMAQPSQDSYGTTTGYGETPIGPGLIDPNVANNPYANRPVPFQATTQNFDGTQSELPDYQRRNAFVNQITNQLGQIQGQSWQQPGVGAPQLNFPQMWGQAGEMAQQGYQNPFAQAGQGLLGTLQQQSTPPMYNQPQKSGLTLAPQSVGVDQYGRPINRPTAPQQGGISAQDLGIGPSVTYAQPGGGWGHTPTQPSPQAPPAGGRPRAAQSIPPQTPSQNSEEFLAANQEAIKNRTFRYSDIDALGLSGNEARLLKNKVNMQMRTWETLRQADRVGKMFPHMQRGLNQAHAAYRPRP